MEYMLFLVTPIRQDIIFKKKRRRKMKTKTKTNLLKYCFKREFIIFTKGGWGIGEAKRHHHELIVLFRGLQSFSVEVRLILICQYPDLKSTLEKFTALPSSSSNFSIGSMGYQSLMVNWLSAL